MANSPLFFMWLILPRVGKPHIWHSCLILGHDNNGKIVVWEKRGVSGPYNITSLEEVYNRYKKYDGVHWGIRKLAIAHEE